MGTRFASALLAAACLAATCGSAHAEGLKLRPLPLGASVGYGLSLNLDSADGLIEGRSVADEAVQAKPDHRCDSGLSHCLVRPTWSVLEPADLADARTAIAEREAHAHLPFGTGVQYDLSPQVKLRVEYQQYPRENALDLKPIVGELVVGLKFAF